MLAVGPKRLVPLLLGAAAVVSIATPALEQPTPPAPRPAETPTWLECARCHADVDEEWRGSMHAHAWTDPIVQAEARRTPSPTCRACHAPDAAAPERGIDCVACHVRDGHVLAASPTPAGVLAHPIRETPAQATVDACAGCHQFDFSDDGIHDPSEPLQDTLAEWARSTAGTEGRTCQSCHMPQMHDPTTGRHRTTHSLRGLDDAALLADAVRVQATAVGDDTGVDVSLTITGHRIGHAFPTGDLFRQAIVTVRTDAGATDTLVLRRWLAATLDADGADHHLRQVDDTRVPPPGTGALGDTLRLDDPHATSVSWELRLHRLAPHDAVARGLDEHAAGVFVTRGEVAVNRRR